MPQELRVVCCFQCRKFQSDIVKKAKKWTCKLCGAKQSLVKEFARGSGRECRLLVQQLSEKTLQADQFERDVAERVLTGKLELPNVAGDVIRDESERLMASHGQGLGRKLEDGNSKWADFCPKDDEEMGDSLGEIDRKDSWKSKGIGERKDMKSEHFVKFTPSKACEPSSTSRMVPLADFHQMNKQDKKEFKIHSQNHQELNSNQLSSPISMATSSTAGLMQPLFSFKPKSFKPPTEELQAIESISKFTPKRAPSEECHDKEAPVMSFAKKSKWSSFKSAETESGSTCTSPNSDERSQRSKELESSSKWSRFVAAATEEDDEFFQ